MAGQQDFSNASEKISFFTQNMGFFEKVLSTAFEYFPSLLVHSTNKMTKYLILIILDKLLEFSPPQQLKPFITKKTISFLAGLLENDDLLVVGNCLLVLQRSITDESLVSRELVQKIKGVLQSASTKVLLAIKRDPKRRKEADQDKLAELRSEVENCARQTLQMLPQIHGEGELVNKMKALQ